MINYKLTIQYDGARYKGWQRLGNGENTIQAKLESVLTQFVGEKVEIIGSSRTDASVNALAQIANFKSNKIYNESDIKKYLNKYLPNDISVKEVTKVAEDFHSRYNAKFKTYLYKIWNEDSSNPFMRKYSMHIEKNLNILKMREASKFFIGEHDFTAFSNAKSKKKSMIREIYSIDIEVKYCLIEIRIRGNGFLYNMVRRIVGTLVAVGLGEVNADNITGIIESKQRKNAGYIADACGLYLENIEF